MLIRRLKLPSHFYFCQTKQKPATSTILNSIWKIGRYDKPIGAILLYTPCIWGTILGQPVFDPASSNIISHLKAVLWYSAVFAVGSFVMRAAGCIINDICDRDIDGRVNYFLSISLKVQRTKTRPLVSGDLTIN
jgi:4-hydroxybenzoate polyprenyltransferase